MNSRTYQNKTFKYQNGCQQPNPEVRPMTNRIMLGIDNKKLDDDLGEGGDDEGDDFDDASGDDDEW